MTHGWRIAGASLAALIVGLGALYMVGVTWIPLTIAGPEWTFERLAATGAGWELPLWFQVVTVGLIALTAGVAIRVGFKTAHQLPLAGFVSVGLLLIALAAACMSFMWFVAGFAMADNVHPTYDVPYIATLSVAAIACLVGSVIAAFMAARRKPAQ